MQLSFDPVYVTAMIQVISMDVSPGGLAVSSDMQGNVNVWTTNNGEVRVCNLMKDLIFCYLLNYCCSGGKKTSIGLWMVTYSDITCVCLDSA